MNKINRIYIHIPFCNSKCGYCTFHSIPAPDDEIVNSYFEKLEKDFCKEKENTGRLDSIFIGGGTPGYLSSTNLEKLFVLIRNNFKLSGEAEISIECNPESLTGEKVKIIEGFANRISLGIQTFSENHRKTLGRVGSLKKVYDAIELLCNSKTNNISCDIIYGIKGQTVKDFEDDVCFIVNQKIFKHFSAYALTLEGGSQISSLYSKKEKLKMETVSAKMWKLIPEIIKNTGFKRYEISNYSLQRKECRHNLDIWFGGKYLGFGPAASSFDSRNRWTQQTFYKWLKNEPPVYDRISRQKRMNEIFIMGLRTVFGWAISKSSERNQYRIRGPYPGNLFPVSQPYIKKLNENLTALKKSGLLKITGENSGCLKVMPTEKGLSFWNEIALQLI